MCGFGNGPSLVPIDRKQLEKCSSFNRQRNISDRSSLLGNRLEPVATKADPEALQVSETITNPKSGHREGAYAWPAKEKIRAQELREGILGAVNCYFPDRAIWRGICLPHAVVGAVNPRILQNNRRKPGLS